MLKNALQIRQFSTKLFKNHIFITAAVRTPNANYENIRISQLASTVIDEVLKRATVPRTAVNKLLIKTTCSENERCHLEEATRKLGISTTIKSATGHVECTADLLDVVEIVQRATNSCIIVGDVHPQIISLTPQGDSAGSRQTTGLSRNMLKGGIFATDIVPIMQRQGRSLVSVNADEPAMAETAGAAAVMLAGAGAVKRLGLQPLAQIIGIQVSDESEHAVENLCLRANLRPEQLCNYSVTQTSITHLLAQLTHALPPGGYGCAVIDNESNQSTALLIERAALKPKTTSGKAELTLYTKDPCSLCDDLVAELEDNFQGQYVLKKVYIDNRHNVRFLRLYRHDIPVLFLNGEFICMHRLNVELLRHKMKMAMAAATASTTSTK